jgi:hypothetical protein
LNSIPVPEITVLAEPPFAALTVKFAVKTPLRVGAKITARLQESPTARIFPTQLSEMMLNCEASGPVMVSVMAVVGSEPVFWTWMGPRGLRPTATWPKSILVGDTVRMAPGGPGGTGGGITIWHALSTRTPAASAATVSAGIRRRDRWDAPV